MYSHREVERIYSDKVHRKYDSGLPARQLMHFNASGIAFSKIKKGDTVIVFCCGTGLDFAAVQRKIGCNGRIVGVDFSEAMLAKAQERILDADWKNVDLVQASVTEFDYRTYLDAPADAGICMLGMSIIPEYYRAYDNLLASVKTGGSIVIGDVQLAPWPYGIFNPLTVWLAKSYGGSWQGHRNTRIVYNLMKEDLADLGRREYNLKSYFVAWGTRK